MHALGGTEMLKASITLANVVNVNSCTGVDAGY